MKTREFVRRFVEASGAVLIRRDGDHHIFRLPNGRTFLVPMGGSHTEAPSYLISKLRRTLREPSRAA